MEPIWITRTRDEMKLKGFNMRSLSAAVEQNETYIRDMLIRRRSPSVESLIRIAAALEVPVAYLVGETDRRDAGDRPNDPETQLRLALLAYGVDDRDLKRIVAIVRGFKDDFAEQSEQSLGRDQSEPASPRLAKEPSE